MLDRQHNLTLRPAVVDDIPQLRSLIALSVRELQKNDYSPEQLAIAVETLFTLDTQLVTDSTYFVIEDSSSVFAACGGWSARSTALRWRSARRSRQFSARCGDGCSKDPCLLRASCMGPERSGLMAASAL